MQPVDRAIAWLKAKPHSLIVADFGCGDAKIAASVPQKVHSLDLVAGAPGVIACNMAATTLGRLAGMASRLHAMLCGLWAASTRLSTRV